MSRLALDNQSPAGCFEGPSQHGATGAKESEQRPGLVIALISVGGLLTLRRRVGFPVEIELRGDYGDFPQDNFVRHVSNRTVVQAAELLTSLVEFVGCHDQERQAHHDAQDFPLGALIVFCRCIHRLWPLERPVVGVSRRGGRLRGRFLNIGVRV